MPNLIMTCATFDDERTAKAIEFLMYEKYGYIFEEDEKTTINWLISHCEFKFKYSKENEYYLEWLNDEFAEYMEPYDETTAKYDFIRSSCPDLVDITRYLRDFDDFGEFHRIYRDGCKIYTVTAWTPLFKPYIQIVELFNFNVTVDVVIEHSESFDGPSHLDFRRI